MLFLMLKLWFSLLMILLLLLMLLFEKSSVSSILQLLQMLLMLFLKVLIFRHVTVDGEVVVNNDFC